ncbi:MAG: RES family NAD+ phosphorylase [Gemmatimonadales bacterium]|nr:RES family NAD+ phosphorylase [Gemmatimonadales bacterium]
MPWRVFPWDPSATAGQPCSPSYVRPEQGSGRFDLPNGRVLYLAETAVHAVAEKLQRFRGQRLERADLHESGKPLALVECDIPPRTKVADLCDPAVLVRHTLRPDLLASMKKAETQAVATALYDAGYDGLRWWSALSGDWHTIVLFLGRVGVTGLRYLKPVPLTLTHPVLKEACAALGIRL